MAASLGNSLSRRDKGVGPFLCGPGKENLENKKGGFIDYGRGGPRIKTENKELNEERGGKKCDPGAEKNEPPGRTGLTTQQDLALRKGDARRSKGKNVKATDQISLNGSPGEMSQVISPIFKETRTTVGSQNPWGKIDWGKRSFTKKIAPAWG